MLVIATGVPLKILFEKTILKSVFQIFSIQLCVHHSGLNSNRNVRLTRYDFMWHEKKTSNSCRLSFLLSLHMDNFIIEIFSKFADKVPFTCIGFKGDSKYDKFCCYL